MFLPPELYVFYWWRRLAACGDIVLPPAVSSPHLQTRTEEKILYT
jgi:hypothetical protein